MYSVFKNSTSKKMGHRSLVTAVALTLLLAGCGGSETASKENPADASASQSSAKSSSDPAKSGSSSAAADTKELAGDENAPEENFEGAEDLTKAKSVDLKQEQVGSTQELYTKFEKTMGSIETITVEDDQAEEDKATSGADSTADEGSTQLSDATLKSIESVATGAAADEFAASAMEYSANGWTQEGTSKFVGKPKIADSTYQGKPAKLLEVCVDSSDVVIKDETGKVLPSSESPARSLNIFTLIQENGTWKIASHDFPNNPDC